MSVTNYKGGLEKEIAEVKFLIHDLRVERVISDMVHCHVTLDADLEIYNVEQAQAMHADDLEELRRQALSLRKAEKDYQNAVRSFSPEKTILLDAKRYIRKIREICELVLNPRWGRIDKVLSFLPQDARSIQARNHYRNSVRWIAGVHSRIEHFIAEMRNEDMRSNFDIAVELEEYTRNVLYGWLVEKSKARVELRLDRLDPAVIHGNRYRFRRMFFNLVLNAANAMTEKKVGVVYVSNTVEGDVAVLRVRDTGQGMTEDKIEQILAGPESLDGELHSLGFVFVRQTVKQFEGELTIQSTPGEGTTMTVRLPILTNAEAEPEPPSEWADYHLLREVDRVAPRARALKERGATAPKSAPQPKPAQPPARLVPAGDDKQTSAGAMVYADYQSCTAEFPGCIFAIAVTPEDRVEFFTHRPYEKYYNISHEDLSPMFFEATVRGRLEEDDEKQPVLILKAPHNVREYFEFKEVPEKERSADLYAHMVRDEYVRIARTLVGTGLPGELGVLVTDLERFFPDQTELLEREPFPLDLLAGVGLAGEAGAGPGA